MSKIVFKANFTTEEISCKCGCGEDYISLSLMRKVQIIRWLIGRPMIVTSGVRCAKYNLEQGGVKDSEHVPTSFSPAEGIDIACSDSKMRFEIIFLAKILGLRCGDGDGFIHLGCRPSKPQEVLWNYYE